MKHAAIIIGAVVLGISGIAAFQSAAQDVIETLDEQEQELPAMPRFKGPLTVMKPAALVFAAFDSDQDYKISRAEAQAGARNAFERADADNNGRLTLFELGDWREAALGSLDALPGNLSFDDDYDNQVSQSEFESTFSAMFSRQDADEDGSLNHAELMQVLEVPRRKGPDTQRMTDQQCLSQIQRNRL